MDRISNGLQRYWIVALGMAMGLLILLIKLPDYLILNKSLPWFASGAAFVCALIGIRIGWLWKHKKNETINVALFSQPATHQIQENGPLSSREGEVLALIAIGYSNDEIAAQLYVSLSTVKTHTGNIFSKLNVKRRTQAVTKAREMGLLA